MWLQVREQDRRRAVRGEQVAVVIAGGHQDLYRELREACYLFPLAPRRLCKGSPPVKHRMQQKTFPLLSKRETERVERELVRLVSPGNIFPNLFSQPWITHYSYLCHQQLIL